MPRMQPQKRIEPSSDDQRLTTVTHIGTSRDPTCATYFTEKSWVINAYSMTTVARSISAANAYANRRVHFSPSGDCFCPAAKPTKAPAADTSTEARMRKRPMAGVMGRPGCGPPPAFGHPLPQAGEGH